VSSSGFSFRLLVLAAAVALIVVGVTQLPKAPVDVLPEFAPPYLEVRTEALSLSAAEVESLVSLNLEELLNGTPWLESIQPQTTTYIDLRNSGTPYARVRVAINQAAGRRCTGCSAALPIAMIEAPGRTRESTQLEAPDR
jgi:hypothetical protein